MKTWHKVALGVAGTIIAHEWYVASVKRPYRKVMGYAMASDVARKKGKPLIVVGDPNAGNYNWFGKPDYPCGDLSIDIEAVSCPNGIKDDVRNVVAKMNDNSAVIFACATLEYIDNLPQFYHELMRVTGGDLYVVNLEPDSLKTKLATNFGYHFNRKWKIYTDSYNRITNILPINNTTTSGNSAVGASKKQREALSKAIKDLADTAHSLGFDTIYNQIDALPPKKQIAVLHTIALQENRHHPTDDIRRGFAIQAHTLYRVHVNNKISGPGALAVITTLTPWPIL